MSKKIIKAIRRNALQYQPLIEENVSLIKDNVYENLLLQTALRNALGNKTNAIFEEIYRLVSKAWTDANL